MRYAVWHQIKSHGNQLITNGEDRNINAQIRDMVKFWKTLIKQLRFSSFQYTHVNEAISMLEMYLVTDGINKDQDKYMHKKATAW